MPILSPPLLPSALKGGEVQFVTITSERGRDCKFINPWPDKGVDVYHNGTKVQTLKGERLVIKTEPGATFGLRPEGAGPPAAQ